MKNVLFAAILIGIWGGAMAQDTDSKSGSTLKITEHYKIHGMELGTTTWDWVKENSVGFYTIAADEKYFYSIKNLVFEMPENNIVKIAMFKLNDETMQGVFYKEILVEISSIVENELYFEDKEGFISAVVNFFDKKYEKQSAYSMQTEEYRFLGDAKYYSWIDKKSNASMIVKKIIPNMTVCSAIINSMRAAGLGTARQEYECKIKMPRYSINFRDNKGYLGLTKDFEEQKNKKTGQVETIQKNKVLKLIN